MTKKFVYTIIKIIIMYLIVGNYYQAWEWTKYGIAILQAEPNSLTPPFSISKANTQL